ncbi:metallophosphoesterase [Nocardioides sp. cx-173]|uniref:metallophosphoesterase family protein n=1 Tax=Nocardioides sp. cx-173 TaxID=2898796 RepID=UPI001E520B62|nr:metallophosphoesterase [Nocardioides sp. cx-173]MCD4526300.1 metallophosphoesterase [Nocardioides sp. cx-173]UGB43476.1 metallophosphoesterase [Nocardioides sp. cx-173]
MLSRSTGRTRQITVSALGLAVPLALIVALVGPAALGRAPAAPDAGWSSDSPFAAAGSELHGTVTVPARRGRDTVVTLWLSNAHLASVPDACRPTVTVRERASYVSADGRTLTCLVRSTGSRRTVSLDALVDGEPGQQVDATVTVDGRSTPLGARLVTPGAPVAEPDLRLLSSPDFLNADVGDLARGPGFWRPGRTANSTNADYRRALDTILDDWRAERPESVLVAGDLVEGWWGTEVDRSGNFGPDRTLAQRKAALRRAAATYYPQWKERFAERGLEVHAAMGDHEFGDNPWRAEKRRLAPLFEQEFAKRFGRRADGSPRYADRPRGSKHELSAYAWRPRPDVQVLTLNVFDATARGMRIRLDRPQLRWVERVLREARQDGVRWVIAQGHTPIVGPVRSHGSSKLMYEGGAHSPLWRLFKRYGVDLYLSGEVHDVTAVHRDGILQVSHGGLFAFGLTNYLLVDVYDDRMELDLRDYATHWRDAPDGSRLWETRPQGMPKQLHVSPTPFTIGTAVVDGEGRLLDRSGILEKYAG